MVIRRLAGLVVVLASVVVGAPSAEGALPVVFAPNEWVSYCEVDGFTAINGADLATAYDDDRGWVYDLRAGTRRSLHERAKGADINDAGLVVGWFTTRDGKETGFVEDIGTGEFVVVDPGLGDAAALRAVNADGVAVGDYFVPTDDPFDSVRGVFTYDHRTGEVHDLGGLGQLEAEAVDISDTGVIVGARTPGFPEPMRGFWHDLATNATSDIQGVHQGDGFPVHGNAYPAAIVGDVVVGADRNVGSTWSGFPRAYVTDLESGDVDDLGLEEFPSSWATDMNLDGIVVGAQELELDERSSSQRLSISDPYSAFVYDRSSGYFMDLGSPGPFDSDLALVSATGLALGRAVYDLTGCESVMQLRLPPHAPREANVEMFGTTAQLSWMQPDFDGYDPDLTYVVRFDGVEVARVPGPLTSVALPDTPCAGGTYTVTAENAEGASAPSEGAVLVARSCTPAAPAVPVPATPTFTG